MIEKKHNYFYKITNIVNGKYYYGIRSTNRLSDNSYMGGGKALKRAIKKYGKENFVKEIIEYYQTRKEASDQERRIVTLELVKCTECYNIRTGGDNEFTFKGRVVTEEQKKRQSFKMMGRTYTEEHRRKVSEATKGEKNGMYGRKHSEEAKVKCSESQKGVKSAWWGRKHTTEELEKISKANSGSKNAMARKCMINGIKYDALLYAAKALDTTVETVGKKIRSTDIKWKEWNYL